MPVGGDNGPSLGGHISSSPAPVAATWPTATKSWEVFQLHFQEGEQTLRTVNIVSAKVSSYLLGK